MKAQKALNNTHKDSLGTELKKIQETLKKYNQGDKKPLPEPS